MNEARRYVHFKEVLYITHVSGVVTRMASTSELSSCLAFQAEDDSKACGRIHGIWDFLMVAVKYDGEIQCRNRRNVTVSNLQ